MNTEEFLKMLACPRCLGNLSLMASADGKPEGFACEKCQLVYPIRDEIPVMLVEEAIDQASWNAGLRAKGKK